MMLAARSNNSRNSFFYVVLRESGITSYRWKISQPLA
jgi:hypothetical protein